MGYVKSGQIEYRTRFRWVMLFMILIFVMLVSRLFYLQIIKKEVFSNLAKSHFIGRERIVARRGLIVDRFHKILAKNLDTHIFYAIPHYVSDPEKELKIVQSILMFDEDTYNKFLKKIIEYKKNPKKSFKKVLISRRIVSNYCPIHGEKMDFIKNQDALWCPHCGRIFFPLSKKRRKKCPFDYHKLKFSINKKIGHCYYCGRDFINKNSTKCPFDNHKLQKVIFNLQCPICRRTFLNQYARINSLINELPGFYLETYFRRFYPFKEATAHLIGYMNEVNKDDLKRYKGEYRRGDIIGRTGIEKTFERVLKGKNGVEIFVRGKKGFKRNPHLIQSYYKELQTILPQNGLNIELTIDIRVQKLLQKHMRFVRSGAAVVIDPYTGEILGMYSVPSFDPNIWFMKEKKKKRKKVDFYSPHLNKAVIAYPPASTFKIVTALAGFMDGLIDEHTLLECNGFYEFRKKIFKCHNLAGHGKINIVDALKYSCDVYFYKLGEMLGIDRIAYYATNYFGFGSKTGIETYEQKGRIPDREWYEKNYKTGFMPGYTLSVAVGQGAVLATPLQVARAYALLINGGRLIHLHVIRRIYNDKNETIKNFLDDNKNSKKLDIPKEYIEIIKKGLFKAVNEEGGTAYNERLEDILVGGKTGTAEAIESRPYGDEEFKKWLKRSHSWFVGFAPFDNPKIIVVVFIEHGGGGGKHAAPIVMKIINDYFTLKLGNLEEEEQ